MAKSNPDPIDQKVGNRLRTRRNTLSISQEQLGNALGLTFQQVQKYEKGTNRISASRLQQMSQILRVPVSFFFDEGKISHDVAGKTDAQSLSHLIEFLESTEGAALANAFVRIQDRTLRRLTVALIEHLAALDR